MWASQQIQTPMRRLTGRASDGLLLGAALASATLGPAAAAARRHSACGSQKSIRLLLADAGWRAKAAGGEESLPLP